MTNILNDLLIALRLARRKLNKRLSRFHQKRLQRVTMIPHSRPDYFKIAKTQRY